MMSLNTLSFYHSLAWIGGLFSLYYGLKLIYKTYNLLRIYVFSTYPDFSKYGKWSVVTGAAGGIGREIALKLGSKGQNIILIDINMEGLSKTSEEIVSRHGVLTKYLQIDFSEDESIYERIETFLKGYDIGILVNNVGMAAPTCNFIETGNLSNVITNLTRVNMLSAVKMIQLILPGMEQRRRGCIINMSSASALHPTVTGTLYAATKAFIKHLSLSLSYECEDKGVTVQSCCPYFIKTDLTKDLSHWNTFPNPRNMLDLCLRQWEKKEAPLGAFNSKSESPSTRRNGSLDMSLSSLNLIINLLPASLITYELYRRAALTKKQE